MCSQPCHIHPAHEIALDWSDPVSKTSNCSPNMETIQIAFIVPFRSIPIPDVLNTSKISTKNVRPRPILIHVWGINQCSSTINNNHPFLCDTMETKMSFQNMIDKLPYQQELWKNYETNNLEKEVIKSGLILEVLVLWRNKEFPQ